jgi:hypothetical protein
MFTPALATALRLGPLSVIQELIGVVVNLFG